ncbi:MAG: hypothetical protein ABI361_06765 [Nitrososphaera sp.]
MRPKVRRNYSHSSIVIGSPDYVLSEELDRKEAKRKRRRATWAYILGLFAVVFLWRSIWNWADMYLSNIGGFVIGIILVAAVAYLQRDHVRDIF